MAESNGQYLKKTNGTHYHMENEKFRQLHPQEFEQDQHRQYINRLYNMLVRNNQHPEIITLLLGITGMLSLMGSLAIPIQAYQEQLDLVNTNPVSEVRGISLTAAG